MQINILCWLCDVVFDRIKYFLVQIGKFIIDIYFQNLEQNGKMVYGKRFQKPKTKWKNNYWEKVSKICNKSRIYFYHLLLDYVLTFVMQYGSQTIE